MTASASASVASDCGGRWYRLLLQETVDLVEDIAVQFITDTVHAAMQSAAARNPGSSASSSAAKKDEIRLEDLLFAVRKDPRKVARIQVRVVKEIEPMQHWIWTGKCTDV